ncbi:putative mucin TcMUCII [Trypanosoma cruzi]|uniref:Mucin TcMUCII, putative n=2 Tax=Trypanosoma cruzi TaxID=5693 RepID=Q4D9R7_TRYCC|nr:mucin TcMUCII, putative [Trypanosoma cruzi]EAN89271.1 mucin TcMUCII, putative [Trypanosoma cruzi]PWV07993.1 putative mucin TcMUCII [Trypanosoma cruzi]RNC52569.1 mucin TcMUCII [Trypanosoma cruzi]|eukprot:XP_811122.1 mucin TcMUCII [Trypanosoma cruzi strain CL Brener]
MTTCRLLCALLVLALCCCPSVCVTATGEGTDKGSISTLPALSEAAGGQGTPGVSITGQTSISENGTVQTPGENGAVGSENPGIEEVTSGTASDSGKVKSPETGTQNSTRADAEEPLDAPGLQGAAGAASGNGPTSNREARTSDSADPAKTVQEQAQIKGPAGTESRSTSSKEHKGSESQTSQGLSSGNGNTQKPGENDAVGPNKTDGKEPNSGTTTDNGKGKGTGSAPSASPDSTSPGPITEEQPGGSADPVQQIQKANASTTTSTAPEASSTTTTETPSTTTTRAPSRLREIDGSLSSSAWVCAPLLLAVSALAYTTLG